MKILDAHVSMAPVLQAGPGAQTLAQHAAGAGERAEWSRSIRHASSPRGWPDRMRTHLNYSLANRAVADVVTAYPDRFFGFARIYTSGFTDCTRELIRCRDEYGFRGLMLNGDWEYASIGTPEVDPYLSLCQAWRWPVYFHTGTYPLTQPGLLMPLARRFPHLNFIAGHLGYDMIDDAITVARLRPNVYLETSASATPSMIQEVARRCGSDKLICGSGLPYAPPDRLYDTILRLPMLADGDRAAILAALCAVCSASRAGDTLPRPPSRERRAGHAGRHAVHIHPAAPGAWRSGRARGG